VSIAAVDFALQRSGLTASEKLVLVALCRKIKNPLKVAKITTSVVALSELLEMPIPTVKLAMVELKKLAVLDYEKIVKADKPAMIVTIRVVNQAEEDYRIKQEDKAVDFRIDMFDRLAALHPRVGNRAKAWREFMALNPDEALYFQINEGLQKKVANEWNGGKIQSLEKFLHNKLWQPDAPYNDTLPALIKRDLLPVGKAMRMTADWQLPRAWGEWAVEQFRMSREAVLLEADVFKDYWLARADGMAIKLNWESTWRNWIRRKFVGQQQKTFAERNRDYKEERGKEAFKTLASADADYLKLWGFGNEPVKD